MSSETGGRPPAGPRPTLVEVDGRVFAILPIADYQALLARLGPREQDRDAPSIPPEVLFDVEHRGASPARAWRRYRKLTQVDVARRMGINQATLARIEASTRPRADTLDRLARALDLRIEQLRV